MSGGAPAPRILGLCLARNEDRFLGWALESAAAFCDRVLILDNASSDGTRAIAEAFAARHPDARVESVPDAMDTHRFVEPLAGSEWWVLGLDGDEVYDPVGLARLRARILAGEFADVFRLIGVTLHPIEADFTERRARGYLSPTARSITKLYNFGALESWREGRHQRLHGKRAVLRRDRTIRPRRWLSRDNWDAAELRCLHLCFFPRSTADETAARANVSERMKAASPLRRLARPFIGREPNYKRSNYARGPVVERSVERFAPPGPDVASLLARGAI